MMTENGLEFQSAFLASVTEQNSFLKPGALRRYQASLLNTGEFSVISPFSGDRVNTRISTQGTRGQVGYYFRDRTDFWLLTSPAPIKSGYPLVQVVTELDMKRRYLYNKSRPAESLSSEQANALRNCGSCSGRKYRGSAVLIIGHDNFAHHLWNELPALDAWLHDASDAAVRGLSVVATHEPLGPLRDLFPRLAVASFRSTSANVRDVNLRVRVGSQIVTDRVRRIVLDYFQLLPAKPAVSEAVRMLSSAWPRIWMSVRLGSRTPDNQLEFLSAIIQAATAIYPNAAFVLDGFSFPVGFFERTWPRGLRDIFVQRSRAASEFTALLKAKAEQLLGGGILSRTFDVTGFGLEDAVLIAGNCDYYICHGGTLQHKIGWFYAKPGFIHAAPDGLEHFLGQANQAEGAIAPDILPVELAFATCGPDGAYPVPEIRRNFNYRIVDVDRAVEFILGSMRIHLKQTA